jgi:hypothetical protein
MSRSGAFHSFNPTVVKEKKTGRLDERSNKCLVNEKRDNELFPLPFPLEATNDDEICQMAADELRRLRSQLDAINDEVSPCGVFPWLD